MLELVVDNFAGGGGASTGIEAALGRPIDYAINHDPEAVALHKANHPDTVHYCQDVWKVKPPEITRGRKIGLAWFSPDCKHFSKAKGGKPVAKHIRDLAWVVLKWAALPDAERPRIIMLENVEEFRDWGPLIETRDGKMMPCPLRRGMTFRRWQRALERLGYVVEARELRACDYGAPTSRKRLFVIARSDGAPIVWPKPTHAPLRVSEDGIVTKWALGHGLTRADLQGLKPYRTAAEIIDWTLPCRSIFDRKKALADNTLRRIAQGIKRYVFDAAQPFIVPVTHGGDARVHGLDDPLRTVTSAHRGELALVTPHITKFHQGSVGSDLRLPLPTVTSNSHHKRPGGAVPLGIVVPTLIQTSWGERAGQAPRVPGLDKPLGTVMSGGGKHALVAAFLAQHNTGMVGHRPETPLSTIVGKGCTQAVVVSHLINLKGAQRRARGLDQPVPAITAGGTHLGEVRAFLIKYFGTDQDPRLERPLGTVTTKHRFGLVTLHGVDYQIADIGMRMLAPRELFRAQSFPDSYKIDITIRKRVRGKMVTTPLPKSSQIRTCGNSVPPVMAAALVAANYRVPAALAGGRAGEHAIAASPES